MYLKMKKITSMKPSLYRYGISCPKGSKTHEHLRFQKFFRGLYPRTPVSRGASSNSAGRGACNARGGEERGRDGGGRGGDQYLCPPGKNPMDAHGLILYFCQFVINDRLLTKVVVIFLQFFSIQLYLR
jgi:hypothetical protein